MMRNCPASGRALVRTRRNPGGWLAAALVLCMGAGGFASQSSAASLEKISSIVPGYFSSTQSTDMPTADFDGDGLPDIVVLGNFAYSDSIQIVGVQAGVGWKIKQAIVPDASTYFYYSPSLTTWTDTSGAHLLYVRGNLVSIYGGWPLALERQFVLDSYAEITDAQVADVDNNGVPELILASNYSSQAIQAYSLTTGSKLWEVGTTYSYYPRLHIAQLDADPALEIVVSGIPGTVIDGATHAVEWLYKDGIGPFVEHGRFGGSSPRFASLGTRLVMFQAQPWSPLWDLDNIYAQSSAVADIDGDQIDELICNSNAFPNAIRVYDVQTQAVRSSFDESQALQLAAGDFDGDSAIEIAIGRNPNYYQSGENSFRVMNASSGTEEFGILAMSPGPYLAAGFVADAGAVDLVFGSASGSGLDGIITRMDSDSGAVRWRTAANDPLLNLNNVRGIQVASLPGQPQPVIIAFGQGSYPVYNDLVALRSSDGSVLWHINSSNSPLPDNVAIDAIAAVDLDGNALADAVLACTSESRLRLFSTTDQSQIWSSVAMSGDCQGALQVTTGGNRQLVAVLTNALRAYDAQTHLLSWSLPYSNGMTGASYLPHGVAGAELALFGPYAISFFDAETRGLLREFSLPNQSAIQAVVQPPGASIHDLVVTYDGKLHAFDGVSGTISASSEPLGLNAGQYNQLPVYADVDGSVRVAAGSDVAVSTYRLTGLSDAIFANGFEPATR
jgi:hypothetical protein